MTKPVAIVTGGAGGIGRAIGARLVADGYRTFLADIALDRAEAVAATIGAEAVGMDVTSSASVNDAVAKVMGNANRIDVLVNNAGMHMQKLVIEMTDEEWDRIQTVNARSVFLVSRAVSPHMMRAESGRIVNIITKLGFGNPFSSAYIASKNAIWGFTQCLAIELAAYGIRVNGVAPGHIGPGTGFEHAWFAKAKKMGLEWSVFEQQVLKTIPAGRWCRPEDVAAAVSYLVGPGGDYTIGEMIHVTGGFVGYASPPPKVAVDDILAGRP